MSDNSYGVLPVEATADLCSKKPFAGVKYQKCLLEVPSIPPRPSKIQPAAYVLLYL